MVTRSFCSTVYTLGHSRHAMVHFIALLKQHRIERVVDVRGQPYSRFNPQYNRESFAAALAAEGIDYLWCGKHLSGRPTQAEYYGPSGEVLWQKLKSRPEFAAALDAIAAEAASRRLVLVCAEEDPARCHRRFLLTPPLCNRGLDVQHIRGDGRLETDSHSDAAGQPDLFAGKE